jgi:hypothetical protein
MGASPYQFYAHKLLRLFDELRDLELELQRGLPRTPTPEEESVVSKKFVDRLNAMWGVSEALQLPSSLRQVKRIAMLVGDKKIPGTVLSPMLTELRTRIQEDLEDHVYLCIPTNAADRFFSRVEGVYKPKVPAELMDACIVERFPSTSDDIDGTFRCFVVDCYSASMFHLMRVVEVGLMELANNVGLNDPSPSWGAVLQYIEKLVLRTKYQDLDAGVRPYRPMLERLLPQMQAIQRAWRNKFSHVGSKILPAPDINEQIASEIISAVETFMRQLAVDLPSADAAAAVPIG